MNFGNTFMTILLCSPLHFLVSSGMMVLTCTGRKSGRKISVPIGYQLQPDGSLITTSMRSRTWWRNLRGGAPVVLRLRGNDRQATAEVYEDKQTVANTLGAYLTRSPGMGKYFKVSFDAGGQPIAGDLRRAADERVTIHFTLRDSHAV